MVTRPTVHGRSTTVGELRAFFEDDRVHMALLVDDGRLVGVVERCDLAPGVDDRTPARGVARLEGRTIASEATVADAYAAIRRSGRRRLAVTNPELGLLGLLCLKANGTGFCSDEDLAARRSEALGPRQG
jgi:CBS domain-containing protein